MKFKLNHKIILSIVIFITVSFFNIATLKADTIADSLQGRILLQVEANGEAWYVYPKNLKRYYLGRPHDAFVIMKNLSLGVKSDFLKQETFPRRLSGLILLDVEANGEAYYINPLTLKKHYLARPADAFSLMRELGLGILNSDLEKIREGDLELDKASSSQESYIISGVPFSTQAPYANWDDPRQQDGCEEASALMAVSWAKGESFTRAEALETIIKMSDYTKEKYGEYRDLSTEDSLNWIYRDYFKFDKVSRRENISLQEIISEIRKGNLVVAPLNGQIIGNPHFVSPGPMHHALVIIGYDAPSNTFISHDPGTRHGENYKYDADILYQGIRDYPTGYHKNYKTIQKNVIVVEKYL